jgi:hypothetical protein
MQDVPAEIAGPAVMRLSPVDNVMVALRPLKAGESVPLDGQSLIIERNAAVGDKLAAQAIVAGDVIRKYSCPIGTATRPIAPGEYLDDRNFERNYFPTYTTETARTAVPAMPALGRAADSRPSWAADAKRVIVYGGVAVAVLDMANAMTFWALNDDIAPRVILQSVASGVLGNGAFTGGTATAAFGALLHFAMSFAIAGVYWLLRVGAPVMLQRPTLSGVLYGVAVYLVLNHLVVPLSRATPVAFDPAWLIDNLLGHVLLVGLPVAFIARWSAER